MPSCIMKLPIIDFEEKNKTFDCNLFLIIVKLCLNFMNQIYALNKNLFLIKCLGADIRIWLG